MKLDRLLTEQHPWIERELLWHLQQVIRLDSRTALAQETRIAHYLAAQLTAAGIRHELVEPVPGKGSVVAFLDGEGSGRPKSSLLLLAHTDTAEWEEREWLYPPLSGAYRDGSVWGRGAIDCKGLVVIWLVMLLLAAKWQLRPQRSLVFAAVADEEAGGQYGTGWLLEHTRLLQDVGFVLGEGGGYPVFFGEQRYLTCQTGEQGVAAWPGGATIPGRKPAARCSSSSSASISEFCQRVFAEQKNVYRWLAAYPGLWPVLLSRLQASAPVQVDLTALFQAEHLPETDCHTPLFGLITDRAKQLTEAVNVVPYVTPGLSDNRFFRARGIPTYGFFPLQNENAILTIHRANERIDLADLVTAFHILFQVVGRFCQMRQRR